jgi:uncharacterized protein
MGVKRPLIAVVVGIAVCLFGLFAVETSRFVVSSPEPSLTANPKPMQPVTVDPTWITSGNPKFAQVEVGRSPDGRTTNGLWSCEGPTTFNWRFDVDEVVYILEGEVQIDYQGSQFTLHPGDTAAFHAGTQATWTVEKYLKKAYSLHNPGPLGKLWRSWFPAG